MDAVQDGKSVKRVQGIISVIILIFLALQIISSFRLLCLPNQFTYLSFPIRVCDPQLWPFLSFPMYDIPHYPGDLQHRPRFFGILHNDSQVTITPRDLGITTTQFVNLHRSILRSSRRHDIHLVAQLFRSNTGQQLKVLQVGDDPVEFTGSEFIPGTPQIFMNYEFSFEGGDE